MSLFCDASVVKKPFKISAKLIEIVPKETAVKKLIGSKSRENITQLRRWFISTPQ